jgi:hypothetical protein
MKITALVTTLVLGLSSAAMADSSSRKAPEQRDHRTPIAQPYRPAMPAWTTRASSSSLHRGKATIKVATRARFSTLKLVADRGSLAISQLVITFANGRTQVVKLDKTIANNRSATIDLKGDSRQITKIVVKGKAGFRSSYSVLAV